MKNEMFNTGLVIAYFGDRVEVEADNGDIIACYLHRNRETPVVGDQVTWRYENDNKGVIEAIQPRRTLLAKPDYRGKLKPIAANIDVICIIMAPPPVLSEYLIDRYLIAATLLKLQPIIVLNKMDLLTEKNRADTLARLQIYQAIGCAVVMTSVTTGEGLPALLGQLQQKNSVLVGPSGVGKSSIIATVTATAIRVGALSASGAGKHTTTAVRLYHLANDANLIDSPGIRDFNLWPISKTELASGFAELQPFARDCRFRNCQHQSEPDCAVLQAVADNKISAARLASYLRLLTECKEKKWR